MPKSSQGQGEPAKGQGSNPREPRITARLNEEQRKAADELKRRLRIREDSALVTTFIEAASEMPLERLLQFLFPTSKSTPDDSEGSRALLAA